MGYGTFTLEGIFAICELLAQSRITSISLAENGMGCDGAFALIDTFADMPNLCTINLAKNNFDGDVALDLAR
eukprot:449133-Prymnesium_polylepis.1